MDHSAPSYGLWLLVAINVAVFAMFAFSFFKPATTRDWRSFDIGHAPVQPGYDEGSALLFSFSYLLTRLSDAKDWILLPIMPSLQPELLFPYLYQQRTLGYEANRYLRPRLLDLCDARVFLVRYEDGFTKPVWGRAWVAEQLRTHWKMDVNANNVVQVLTEQGL